jgi:hypothetical protein
MSPAELNEPRKALAQSAGGSEDSSPISGETRPPAAAARAKPLSDTAVASGWPSMFDWEAWRARTGGVDGRPAAEGDRAEPEPGTGENRPSRPVSQSRLGSHSGRTGVVVLAVAAVCALLGGLAAFAATLGGPPPSPVAAPSIAPGDVTAAADGTGPDGTGSGGTGPHHGAGHGSGEPSSSAPSDPATAGAAAASHADPHADPFSSAVTSYLAGRAGTALAAVYDVRTGQTWTLGDGRPQATGSIVKVNILQTLLARRPLGLPAADQALARAMIENSSNPAATTLWNRAGQAPGLRAYNASAGLLTTTPSTCLVCAGFAWPGWGLTSTTPADQLLLLRELVDGPLLSPADRGYAVSLMENVEPGQRWGVSAGVPAGVRVALKNAWVPLGPADSDWQINSEGWISGDGRDYLIAVLTTGNPDEQYGITTIDTVSALLWAALA